jgi:D-glycero-D-manno-heptose 1,7-bisphosphate phosphatase
VRRRAVFLDRDGVLNDAVIVDGRPYPPADASALRILPGVRQACRILREAGFTLIAVTNQPDIARGTRRVEDVEAINDVLRSVLNLDDVLFCPHDDVDGCDCRKPRPGMILEAARRWNVDVEQSITVGDRWRDVEAGRSAGTRTVFINRGYAERTPKEKPDLIVNELKECVPWIIERYARTP